MKPKALFCFLGFAGVDGDFVFVASAARQRATRTTPRTQ
jgi:hypothetical protein